MSFIRTAKRENPFVQIDKYFLEDENLSFEAKGLMAYVLSKPNNWTIRKTDLIKRSKSGKTRIESAMLELMSNGYLNWYRLREDDGTFGEWVYDVYERPDFNPEAEKFIKEGIERIQARKNKNKARASKNKSVSVPKVDNQPLDAPKVDYPPLDNPPLDNQPYSNNDFNDIDLSNNYLEEEEDGLQSVVDSYLKNIAVGSKTLPETIVNDLKTWLGKIPADVIKNEIEYAAKKGGKSFGYLETALKQDEKQGIDSIIKLDDKRIAYAASKKANKGHSKRQNKPVREEQLPEWYKSNGEQQEPSKVLSMDEKQALEEEKAMMLQKLAERKAKTSTRG